MSSRVKHNRIRSLADLKTERMRIRTEMNHIEYRLQSDYQSILGIFRPGYWIGFAANKFSSSNSSMQWIMKGYNAVVSMIQKRKAKKKAKPKKCSRKRNKEIAPETIVVNSEF